ncbi:class II aldolase/adducin family protein [Thiolapillus sp.]
MNPSAEGVIKFHLEHTRAPALPLEDTAELRAWFVVLRQLNLLGQNPDRYLGFAYGNISQRYGDGFVISGTQTSGRERLDAEHFSRVTGFDIHSNRLQSRGPCPPSSEAMTHGAVYQALSEAGAVFHVHSPDIWRHAKALGLPETDAAIEYGTPEMAEAVITLLRNRPAPVFSMGGHEDGIVAWGRSPRDAGIALMTVYINAMKTVMQEG